MDDEKFGWQSGRELAFELKDAPTGVFEDHIIAKIRIEGGEHISETDGTDTGGFLRFRKMVGGRWLYFTLPRCPGPDGYLVHELAFIEGHLAQFDIDLLPLGIGLH
ncbi:MAG: hypothetical protein AAFV45_07180 [Pseudomonadota bacterium]